MHSATQHLKHSDLSFKLITVITHVSGVRVQSGSFRQNYPGGTAWTVEEKTLLRFS